MSEAEWKQEAERMSEAHVRLHNENQKLKADLAYAHAILSDAIRQLHQMDAELAALRMEGEVKP